MSVTRTLSYAMARALCEMATFSISLGTMRTPVASDMFPYMTAYGKTVKQPAGITAVYPLRALSEIHNFEAFAYILTMSCTYYRYMYCVSLHVVVVHVVRADLDQVPNC